MKKMNKRGQIELSFGMIFSIIIIIALVATAFYAISYFLKLGKCAQTGLFYKDLEEEVEKAWASEITQKTFSGTIPGSVDKVCFGGLEQDFSDYDEEHKVIERVFRNSANNLFLYKPESACSKDSASYNLKHARTDSFFCVKSDDGKVKIIISKGSSDALATIAKGG